MYNTKYSVYTVKRIFKKVSQQQLEGYVLSPILAHYSISGTDVWRVRCDAMCCVIVVSSGPIFSPVSERLSIY